MSLGRLLTAGSSLVGVRNAGGRYRMSDPRAMPRFGLACNPFVPQARRPELERQTETAASATEAVEQKSEPFQVTRQVATSPKAERSRPGMIARWKAKLRSLILGGPRREIKVSRSAQPTRTPIQVELSLDRITVVRNDLSDSDVEIVAARPAKTNESSIADRVGAGSGAPRIPAARESEGAGVNATLASMES